MEINAGHNQTWVSNIYLQEKYLQEKKQVWLLYEPSKEMLPKECARKINLSLYKLPSNGEENISKWPDLAAQEAF